MDDCITQPSSCIARIYLVKHSSKTLDKNRDSLYERIAAIDIIKRLPEYIQYNMLMLNSFKTHSLQLSLQIIKLANSQNHESSQN